MNKTLLAIFFLLASLFHSTAQTTFSDAVKPFIDHNAPVIVFRHALLIDGTGTAAKPDQAVIIRNGKIEWVGDDAKAVVPKDAQQIDLKGKTLMPGLVMTHEHMYISSFASDPLFLHLKQLPVTFPRLYLAAGATTIRTAGSIEPYEDLRIKKDIDAGNMPGPAMDVTGPYLEGTPAFFPQMKELKDPADAVKFVNYWADQGVTSFKGYMSINKPTLKAAIDAAHKRKLKVTGHLCSVTYGEAATLGIDHLEHGFLTCTDFDASKKENECPMGSTDSTFYKMDLGSARVKNFIRSLVEKKVGVTSTLAVFEGFNANQQPLPQYVLDAFAPDSRDYYLNELERFKSMGSDEMSYQGYLKAAKMEKMFYDAGGLLTVGTDPTGNGGVLAGYGNWRAIELLVEADGFTPLQAIKIATLNGAIALGLDKNIGTIAPGKQADLLIIDGDPSTNITDIRKVSIVFKKGIGFNSKRLFESVKGKVGFY